MQQDWCFCFPPLYSDLPFFLPSLCTNSGSMETTPYLKWSRKSAVCAKRSSHGRSQIKVFVSRKACPSFQAGRRTVQQRAWSCQRHPVQSHKLFSGTQLSEEVLCEACFPQGFDRRPFQATSKSNSPDDCSSTFVVRIGPPTRALRPFQLQWFSCLEETMVHCDWSQHVTRQRLRQFPCRAKPLAATLVLAALTKHCCEMIFKSNIAITINYQTAVLLCERILI